MIFAILLILIVLIIFLSYIFYQHFKHKKVLKSKNSNNHNQTNSKDDNSNVIDFKIINKDSINNPHNIKEIYLGQEIILVESGCFINCISLSSIKVDEENSNYASRGGVLFSNDLKTIISYPACKSTSTYFIPQGVEEIESYAFMNNKYLKYVVLPTSLKYISENAFINCKNINQIVIPEDINGIHPRAFSFCPRITIRGYENSISKDYCKEYYIPFEHLNS